MHAFLTTTAFASPLNKGDSWSAHLGYETDLGSARDPGDRDGAMAGSASGPSIGLQWWHQDWLAVEAHLFPKIQLVRLWAIMSKLHGD